MLNYSFWNIHIYHMEENEKNELARLQHEIVDIATYCCSMHHNFSQPRALKKLQHEIFRAAQAPIFHQSTFGIIRNQNGV